MAVVKDEAYGHGAFDIARIAIEEGAWGFGLSTLEEAMTLREAKASPPRCCCSANVRKPNCRMVCGAHDLTVCVNEPHTVRKLARASTASFAETSSSSSSKSTPA